MENRPNGFAVLNYGSLLFSRPMKYTDSIIEYTKNNVERKFPYCDYYYQLDDEWRYGFIDNNFIVIEKEYELPFDRKNPPIQIEGNFALLSWRLKRGYRNIPQDNYSKVLKRNVKLTMQPYGATYLRMTEIPLIKEEK